MGAVLSPVRQAWPVLPGLRLLNRGKVRDTYDLGNGQLLSVATDAVSIFDFVLNALVPTKGIILNAMTHYWLDRIETELGFPTHRVASGLVVDAHLPPELRGNDDLRARAMVVTQLHMLPVEFIYRRCITGSGLQALRTTGSVCGHKLPRDLKDGDLLPRILDTPSTKAEVGHDEHLEAYEVRRRYPEATYLGSAVFQFCSWVAEQAGLMLADTKFEIGLGLDADGVLTIADEVVTPDSSRFWNLREWRESRHAEDRRAPQQFDKQIVRNWGLTQGINKRNPEVPDDINLVHALEVPDAIIAETVQAYRYIFWKLTGRTIERYLGHELGVPMDDPNRRITVILGSESDLPSVRRTLECTHSDIPINIHVISCHRNPDALASFAESCDDSDIVIAVGGKAFALPGVLAALLNQHGRRTKVIGVGLGEPGTESYEAARLSIKELPGRTVVMDEVIGEPYMGTEGFGIALNRALMGELPPSAPAAQKPPDFHLNIRPRSL